VAAMIRHRAASGVSEMAERSALPEVEPGCIFALDVNQIRVPGFKLARKEVESRTSAGGMPMSTLRHHSHTRSLLAAVAVAIPAMLIGSGMTVGRRPIVRSQVVGARRETQRAQPTQ
jgi:hypothetical protein